MTNNNTQKQKIHDHMKTGKSISPKEAFNLCKCFRLSAVINEIVQDGVKVSIDNTREYAVYSLV